jgi:hypothetical protein
VSFLAVAADPLDGVWQGTFQRQPVKRRPGGTQPEESSRFELRLRRSRDKVSGWFTNLDQDAKARRPIQHGRMFGQRACFDVIDQDSHMRWCISLRHDRLQGVWSRGPEGGPLLDGMGAGGRLFAVTAGRVR